MSTLGILLIFGAILVLTLDYVLDKLSINWRTPVDLVKDGRKFIWYLVIVAGVFMAFNPWIYNPDGHRTYVLDKLFKTEKVVFQPGWTWAGILHKEQAWPDVMSTVFDDEHGRVPIRFNDATQATATANIRWQLPSNEDDMIALHRAYRHPDKLQTRTFVPYGRECLAFAAQLMESETHYSGGQSKLKEDFRDQLLNGQYVLETNTSFVYDSVANEKIKITKAELRLDPETGLPKRIPSDVQTYAIRAVFAAVPHVDYADIVDQKLEAKIDQSTKESIAKQALITAEQEALTAAAEGRKLVAQTKAKYEAEKQKAVIQAEQEKEVAREQALQAKFTADKIEEEGRAQAAANRALVAAGLTPEQRMNMDIQIADVVSKNIANAPTPQVVFVGSGGGSGGADEALKVFGAERALELIKKLNTDKK